MRGFSTGETVEKDEGYAAPIVADFAAGALKREKYFVSHR